ncbi:MAG: hypothetical protein IKR48_02625 [Kiritimatiellae bacterium]|nr:hypothetical protein [Kiritimatiellia bacterium]
MPVIRHLPSGGILAVRLDPPPACVRLFDTPVALANARCGELADSFETEGAVSASSLSPTEAVRYWFRTAPFVARNAQEVSLSEEATPAFRAAFHLFSSSPVTFIRGELDAYLIGVARDGGVFSVAGITIRSRVLTVRLEDIWYRLPVSVRASFYDLTILRDAHNRDTEEQKVAGVVEEGFPEQPGNTRVVLELHANGGFVLTCRPSSDRLRQS